MNAARPAVFVGAPPWKEQHGYPQTVKVDDTIYVSGQLSHDEAGNMVGPALAPKAAPVDPGWPPVVVQRGK